MPYLESGPVIDWHEPTVQAHAATLRRPNPKATIKACFEWVRDEVAHCCDAQRGPVVFKASDVLRERIGYCYSKAHLLAALLRANGVKTALCYQRLTLDGPESSFCLHGLNAVWFDGDWLRIDSRGNKAGVNAQFNPPNELLAFPIEYPGERDIEGIFARPLPVVVDALSGLPDWRYVLDNLPDAP